MPRGELRPTLEEVKELLAADWDFLRPLVQTALRRSGALCGHSFSAAAISAINVNIWK